MLCVYTNDALELKALLHEAIFPATQRHCKASCRTNFTCNSPLCNLQGNEKLRSKLQEKLNNLVLFAKVAKPVATCNQQLVIFHCRQHCIAGCCENCLL